jgi:murein DD-endopeptidase MepM/ murein hydrolase activator NlpD
MSSDPNDEYFSGARTSAPSSPSSNPFASSPSTSAVSTSTPGSSAAQQVDPGTPPKAFVTAVNNALSFRLGTTKSLLIPAADKKALIEKIWQDPNIQAYWTQNGGRLSDPNVAGTLGVQINSVMMGQGNDPSIAVDYTNMLQAAGVPLTASEQAALAGATQAINAPVPRPFNATGVSGYDYGAPMPAGGWTGTGQSYGWNRHMGIDYGTRAGDRIVSPFAGTVHVASGVAGYGNIVYVTLDNGWTMGFGHVASGALQNGARVNPGDLIAIAGANVGSAKGSVTIVTWQDPTAKWSNGVLQGGFQNPHDALDPIFNGTTFAGIGAPGAAGTGMPTVNKILDAEYPSIKTDWQTYFGTPPTPGDVYDILSHGNTPQEWLDYIRSMPSHIDGMLQGQYHDTRSTVDQVSGKLLGHPGTDGIVKELHDQQMTSPNAVQLWYDQHAPNQMPPATYQQIYKAVNPIMNGIFNEAAGADPRDIRAIHGGHGLQGPGGYEG